MSWKREELLRLLCELETGVLVVPDGAGGLTTFRVALARCDGTARLWVFARAKRSLSDDMRGRRVCLELHRRGLCVSVFGTAGFVRDEALASTLWSAELSKALSDAARADCQLLSVEPSRVELRSESTRPMSRDSHVRASV